MDLQTYLKIVIDLTLESDEIDEKNMCSHFIYHTVRHHKVCSICYLVLNQQRKDSVVKATKIIKLPEWVPLKTMKETDLLFAHVAKEVKPSMRTAVLYACVSLCKHKLSYEQSEELIKFFKLSVKKIEMATEFIFARIQSYKLDQTIFKEPILDILTTKINTSIEIGLYIMHYCNYYKKSFKMIWNEMNHKFKFKVFQDDFCKAFGDLVLYNMPIILADILAFKHIYKDCIRIDGLMVEIKKGQCFLGKKVPKTMIEWNTFLSSSYVYEGKIIRLNFRIIESKIEKYYFSHDKFLLRLLLNRIIFK